MVCRRQTAALGWRHKKTSRQNDSRKFEHAAIVRKEKPTQAVSSFTIFLIYDLRFTIYDFCTLKILVAITGASGALYAQRLLDNLDPRAHEIHVVQSNYAQQVIAEELPGGLRLPAGVEDCTIVKSMNAPFASGSNPPDAMVVIPCTMGTMGRIAHGYSEDVLLRAADVVLKERKKVDSGPARNAVEPGPRQKHGTAAAGRRDDSAGESGFLLRTRKPSRKSWTPWSRACWIISACRNRLVPRWAEEKE